MHVPSPAVLRHPSNFSDGFASSCRLSTVELLLSSGSHRLLYLSAAFTALRVGELYQLVWGDARLEGERPHFNVRDETTKNKKPAAIPLPPGLVAEFRLLKVGGIADLVFNKNTHPDRVIRRVIEKAGIERFDAMGRKLDFHALRYTFATMLAWQGVSQRIVQELMRHSDPRLTANIYTDTALLSTFKAVERLDWNEKALAVGDSQIDSQELGTGCLDPSYADTETQRGETP